jgi:hypothetical protein
MRFVLSAIAFLAIFGCGILEMIFGFPQMYIQREVQASELVGTWNITPYGEANVDKWLKDSPDWGIGAPWKSITFNKDGTCQVKFEKAWYTAKTPLPTNAIVPDILPCSWKLAKISNIDNDDVTGVELESGDNYVGYTSFYIFEENGELMLWNLIGYVDHFSRQEFKKSSN